MKELHALENTIRVRRRQEKANCLGMIKKDNFEGQDTAGKIVEGELIPIFLRVSWRML